MEVEVRSVVDNLGKDKVLGKLQRCPPAVPLPIQMSGLDSGFRGIRQTTQCIVNGVAIIHKKNGWSVTTSAIDDDIQLHGLITCKDKQRPLASSNQPLLRDWLRHHP